VKADTAVGDKVGEEVTESLLKPGNPPEVNPGEVIVPTGDNSDEIGVVTGLLNSSVAGFNGFINNIIEDADANQKIDTLPTPTPNPVPEPLVTTQTNQNQNQTQAAEVFVLPKPDSVEQNEVIRFGDLITTQKVPPPPEFLYFGDLKVKNEVVEPPSWTAIQNDWNNIMDGVAHKWDEGVENFNIIAENAGKITQNLAVQGLKWTADTIDYLPTWLGGKQPSVTVSTTSDGLKHSGSIGNF